MGKKILITQNQALRFNNMLFTLRKLAKEYQTSDQLRKSSEKDIGLEYEEALEYAYDNIKLDAAEACLGLSPLKIEKEVANG